MSRRVGARTRRATGPDGGLGGWGGSPDPVPYSSGRVAWVSSWYGADTTHLSLAAGNTRIAQFVNQKSGVAWEQTGATEQASWQPDSLQSSLNGFPSGDFDGGDFYLLTEAAILAIAQNNTDHIIYFAASPDVALANTILFCWGNSGSASGYRAYGVDITGHMFANASGNGAPTRLGNTVLTDGKPHVFAFRLASNQVAMWLDGVADNTPSASAQDAGSLSINRASLGSRCRSTNDLKWNGQGVEMFLYTGTQTDAQIVAQSLWLYERWQLGYARFLAAGDSLSRGFGTVSGLRLEERIAPTRSTQRYSAATNGWETSDLTTTEATLVTPRRRAWSTADVITIWIGNNDIVNTADSAATIYARIAVLIDSYQATGFEVIAITVTHRQTSQMSGDTVTPYNTICDALNVLILANSAGAEATVDAQGLLAAQGYDPDTFPNTYSSDGTHITDAAYSIIVPAINAAINALV